MTCFFLFVFLLIFLKASLHKKKAMGFELRATDMRRRSDRVSGLSKDLQSIRKKQNNVSLSSFSVRRDCPPSTPPQASAIIPDALLLYTVGEDGRER